MDDLLEMNIQDALDDVGRAEREPCKVKQILDAIQNGWGGFRVRVKQDGKMKFLPMDEVKDQRLVFKILLDMLKQAAKEEGIRLRSSGGLV